MVQQVVMRLDGGTPTFETQENPLSKAPLSFEDASHGLRIPRLGTQDILRIAEFAVSSGFALDGFQVSDRTMTSVQDPLASKVSRELVRALTNGVPAADVEDLLLERWPSLSVTGVTLTTPDHRTARLQRQGVFWAPSGWSPIRFLGDAWQAVHFW